MYKNPVKFIRPKKDFFAELGLDINKKLILLGGSDFYYSEDTLPRKLNEMIADGRIKEPTQVYFRPHPSSLFTRHEYELDKLKHIILDGKEKDKTGFSDGDKLINLFYHSDIIIHIASTLAIDAAIYDLSLIHI